MRAQAALMESMFSIAIIATAIAIMANSILGISASTGAIDEANAAHDFIGMEYHNSSEMACILLHNYSCIHSALKVFVRAYNLNYMSVSGYVDDKFGNASLCSSYYSKCFVLPANYSIECISECTA
ncbi:MAG: hypothetical protein ACP5RM_02915 [Candidatus Micrarchaeia archaeon]